MCGVISLGVSFRILICIGMEELMVTLGGVDLGLLDNFEW